MDFPPAQDSWPLDPLPPLDTDQATGKPTAYVVASHKRLFGIKRLKIRAFDGSYNGFGREFYQNVGNRVRFSGEFRRGLRHGVGSEYLDLSKSSKVRRSRTELEFGPLIFRGQYVDGVRQGIGAEFDPSSGELVRRAIFESDDLVEEVNLAHRLPKLSRSDLTTIFGKFVRERFSEVGIIHELDVSELPFFPDDVREVGRAIVHERQVLSSSAFALARNSTRRSVRCLALLDNPNVIRPLSWFAENARGTQKPRCGYVVEFFPESLHEILQRVFLARPEATLVSLEEILWKTQVARQCASGLCALHRLGIVHRDVRPENVAILESDGWNTDSLLVKITGFDCACEDHFLTSPQAEALVDVVGVPRSMCPEMLRRVTYNSQADVYSFGLFMHQLYWTHPNPFEGVSVCDGCGENLSEGFEGHILNCKFRPPVDDFSLLGIPEALANLISRCFAHLPSERPSMVEICQVLESVKDSTMSDIAERDGV